MPHWRLFYHLGWATRDRTSLLAGQVVVQTLERSFEVSCQDLSINLYAVGTMPDHVHLACSIPPSLSIADTVKRLKGASSRRLNETIFVAGDVDFSWQSEYGIYSFSERVLPKVVAYVRNQEARHAAADLWSGFEQMKSRGTSKEHARYGN